MYNCSINAYDGGIVSLKPQVTYNDEEWECVTADSWTVYNPTGGYILTQNNNTTIDSSCYDIKSSSYKYQAYYGSDYTQNYTSLDINYSCSRENKVYAANQTYQFDAELAPFVSLNQLSVMKYTDINSNLNCDYKYYFYPAIIANRKLPFDLQVSAGKFEADNRYCADTRYCLNDTKSDLGFYTVSGYEDGKTYLEDVKLRPESAIMKGGFKEGSIIAYSTTRTSDIDANKTCSASSTEVNFLLSNLTVRDANNKTITPYTKYNGYFFLYEKQVYTNKN